MKTLNHILLIDDNLADNEFHEIVLEKGKFANQVTAFSDAREALEYLKQSVEISETLPDLIFLDILMPRTDGFELLAEFKKILAAKPNSNRKIKICFLSGNYDPVMKIYLNSPNYDDLVLGYQVKPLTQKMLTEIIEKHF